MYLPIFRPQAVIVSEISTVFPFPIEKHKLQNFVEIGPPVPEEKIFLKAFTIYGHGSHLGHVT